MHGIFISYRREDSSGYTGRIYDRLVTHFGEDAVFRDIDGIRPGQDFVQVIGEREKCCGAVVAVVGREWLTIANPDGTRRLQDPADFVRMELGSALKSKVCIIPALVEGAKMPRSEDLPDDLKPFAHCNAISIVDELFEESTGRLIHAVEGAIETAEKYNVWWRVRHRLVHGTQGKSQVLLLLGIAFALTISTILFFESANDTRDASFGLSEVLFVFLCWLLTTLGMQWLWNRLARKKGSL